MKGLFQLIFKLCAFLVKIRRLLVDNSELRIIMDEIIRKTDNNTKNIEVVFRYLDVPIDIGIIEKQENHFNALKLDSIVIIVLAKINNCFFGKKTLILRP